jgi:hypothetical protein
MPSTLDKKLSAIPATASTLTDVVVYGTQAGVDKQIPLSTLTMDKSVYDPSGIAGNVFDRTKFVNEDGRSYFNTRAAALAYTPAVAPKQIVTAAYSTPGDNGGATYEYVGTTAPECYLFTNKIRNGDFRLDKYWTKTLSVGTGTLGSGKFSATGATGNLTQSVFVNLGAIDEYTFTISNYSAGTLKIITGSTSTSNYSANGTYTVRLTYAGSDDSYNAINFNLNMTLFSGDVSNVSMRRVYNTTGGRLSIPLAGGGTAYYLQRGDFNLKAFGATGDGSADDTLILRDWLRACSGYNRRGYMPSPTVAYKVTDTLLGNSTTLRPYNNINIYGDRDGNAKIYHQAVSKVVLGVAGRMDLTTIGIPVTQAVVAGSNKVRVTSGNAAWFQAGDWVVIIDTTQTITDNTTGSTVAVQGERHQVAAIEGTDQIRLKGRTEFAYTTSAELRRVDAVDNIKIKDITFENPVKGSLGTNVTGTLAFGLTTNVHVIRCKFIGIEQTTIQFTSYCHLSKVQACEALNLYDDTNNVSYFIYANEGCTFLDCLNNKSDRVRHHITTGTPGSSEMEPSHIRILNSDSKNTEAAGFDTHPGGGRHIDFINCVASYAGMTDTPPQQLGAMVGFSIRTRHTRLISCKAIGFYAGVNATRGSHVTVRDFEAHSCNIGWLVSDSPYFNGDDLRMHGDHAQAVYVQRTTTLTNVRIGRVTVIGDTKGDAATGTITFTGAPSNNDTVTVNGEVFTFKTTPSGANDILIVGTALGNAINLSLALSTVSSANISNKVVADNVKSTSNIIRVTALPCGTAGNAYTLTESAANVAVSGAGTLAGGGGNNYAVYFAYWEDTFSVGTVVQPSGATAAPFGGSIPTSYAFNYVSITATATIKATPHTVLADTTAGNITLNLPTAASMKGKYLYAVKTAGANTLTWDGDASETIDGSATKAVTTNSRIFSDGTSWYTVSAA